MREGIAAHDRRAQVDAASKLRLARALAILRRHVLGAGRLQAVLDRAVDELGHLRVREAGELRVFVLDRARRDRAELFRERVGDLGGMFGHDDGGGVDAASARRCRRSSRP